MCLAVPMRITEISGNIAVVEQEGVSRRVRIDFIPNLQVGDYVLIHAGIAIERLKAEEAEETLKVIRTLNK
ncbi:MAG: HypC/HybG/HupF family hydrogenase formation chaperone [Armatimonadetes bacterium]|nr:HypC/HybG/HupF family hydrogenase formation chaperone [Armatimonadota bacterium]